MSTTDFHHKQHAHCESGVTSNLLTHHGLPLSEPLAFGIGAGLFFAHIPFIKVSGTPGTTFRTWPGAIFKRVAQRLHVDVHTEKFRSPEK
ncbi:MAG TPA: BtrH N-terminal domain-containing protein, partial [Flavipsychrobacter sp.]|nr:BtrH N-terminal domain-containing protein [Flavipsychrobacter sp.]